MSNAKRYFRKKTSINPEDSSRLSMAYWDTALHFEQSKHLFGYCTILISKKAVTHQLNCHQISLFLLKNKE